MLLEHDADVNAVNDDGETPLFYAINQESAEDTTNESSGNYEAQNEIQQEIIHLLKSKGAKEDIINSYGEIYTDWKYPVKKLTRTNNTAQIHRMCPVPLQLGFDMSFAKQMDLCCTVGNIQRMCSMNLVIFL